MEDVHCGSSWLVIEASHVLHSLAEYPLRPIQ